MDIRDYIVHETERQSGTMAEAIGMYDAWRDAIELQHMREDFPGASITEDNLCHWANLINGVHGYRNVPVYFADGGHAVNFRSIPNAMERLVEAINDADDEAFFDTSHIFGNAGYKVGSTKAVYLTREFLIIHPFVDGNGRVASIMYNYLNDSLHDPVPLPYYFGDK